MNKIEREAKLAGLKQALEWRVNYAKQQKAEQPVNYRLLMSITIGIVFRELIEWMPEEVQPLLKELEAMEKESHP